MMSKFIDICDDILDDIFAKFTLLEKFQLQRVSKRWQEIIFDTQTSLSGYGSDEASRHYYDDNTKTSKSDILPLYHGKRRDQALRVLAKTCNQINSLHFA